jgi:hypothetical protein
MSVLGQGRTVVTGLMRRIQSAGRNLSVPRTDDDPDLLTFLGRCHRIIAFGAILGGLMGLSFAVLQPTEYEARAQVSFPQPSTVGPTVRADPTRRLQNEAALILSPRAMEEVARLQGNGSTRKSVRERVRVITSPDADLLTVVARGTSPEAAARLADITAETYVMLVQRNALDDAEAQVQKQREVLAALQVRRGQLLDLAAREPGSAVTAELRAVDEEIARLAGPLARTTIAESGPGSNERVSYEPAPLPVRPVQPRSVHLVVQGTLIGTLIAAALAWALASRGAARPQVQDFPGRDEYDNRTSGIVSGRADKPVYRWFPPLLGILLLGYMFFSRSFAYLSVPGTPIYVGELVLLVGFAEAFRHRRLIPPGIFKSTPLALLFAFMGLGALRLAWDFPIHGIDGVRDSAVWYYGLFAILVTVAARTDRTFTLRLVRWFGRVSPFFILWVPVAILLAFADSLSSLTVPGSHTPINSVKGSDLAVLTALALAFNWFRVDTRGGRSRTRRTRDLLTVMGIFALLVLASQGRGPMLAALLGCGAAVWFLSTRERKRLAVTVLSALVIIVAPLVLLDVRLSVSARELSVQQVVTNVSSFLTSDSENLSESETGLRGTVEWRARYFSRIINGSLTPDHAIVGIGFGPILSQMYDPGGSQAKLVPPLRNAHNSHVTILARMGIAGLALWVLFWIFWFRDVGGVARRIRRDPDDTEAALAVCVISGGLAVLATALVDPSFEGPQSAIWAWTLVGLGIALAGTSSAERAGQNRSPEPHRGTSDGGFGRPRQYSNG